MRVGISWLVQNRLDHWFLLEPQTSLRGIMSPRVDLSRRAMWLIMDQLARWFFFFESGLGIHAQFPYDEARIRKVNDSLAFTISMFLAVLEFACFSSCQIDVYLTYAMLGDQYDGLIITVFVWVKNPIPTFKNRLELGFFLAGEESILPFGFSESDFRMHTAEWQRDDLMYSQWCFNLLHTDDVSISFRSLLPVRMWRDYLGWDDLFVLLVFSLVVDTDIDTNTPYKRRDVVWRDPDLMLVKILSLNTWER